MTQVTDQAYIELNNIEIQLGRSREFMMHPDFSIQREESLNANHRREV